MDPFKQHETSADLKNEDAVAQLMMQKWNCHAMKLPKHYRIDFALTRGGAIKAYAEVKCRSITMQSSKVLILGLAKACHLKMFANESNVPGLFVVRYTDGVYYLDISKQQFPIHYGGQMTRQRDNRDMEPVCQIPTQLLKRLGK